MRKRQRIKQNKLEIYVALLFSAIIFISSSTEVGYVPINEYRSLDLALIPALFAAMIGGYRVGIPVAIAWTFIGYFNEASNLQIYTFEGLLCTKIIFVVSAVWFYRLFKKKYKGSPFNVYKTILAAVTVKALVANVILAYTSDFFIYSNWLHYGMREYVLEVALCMLAMGFLIKHLRQVHILNGIKRKKKKHQKK